MVMLHERSLAHRVRAHVKQLVVDANDVKRAGLGAQKRIEWTNKSKRENDAAAAVSGGAGGACGAAAYLISWRVTR